MFFDVVLFDVLVYVDVFVFVVYVGLLMLFIGYNNSVLMLWIL